MEHASAAPADAETKFAGSRGDDKIELRLWLRLLTCASLIEGEVRGRLRDAFDATLPRFDLMAQLEKEPEGMTLSALSQRMMVSNGNLTALVERLVASGHVTRRRDARDGRAQRVRLTAEGRRAFAKMARAHEDWIKGMTGDLSGREAADLMALLARLKTSVRNALSKKDGVA